MRYFNLKSLNNVRVRNLDPNINVRRVFDPFNSDLSDYGAVTEANSNFPKHYFGAGESGSFLTNFVDLGGVADTNVISGGNYDFGLITE
tara:strand:- start:1383 stop:1649 length:267 start_codon:yes stop_codon:yes gene_type:complete